IEHAAIEARLRALHVRARKNNATVPASHFCCGANKGGKADHQQHRPARRNAEKSVQGETEITSVNTAIGITSRSSVSCVANKWNAKLPMPIRATSPIRRKWSEVCCSRGRHSRS